jgi:hypothetical protein
MIQLIKCVKQIFIGLWVPSLLPVMVISIIANQSMRRVSMRLLATKLTGGVYGFPTLIIMGLSMGKLVLGLLGYIFGVYMVLIDLDGIGFNFEMLWVIELFRCLKLGF